MDKMELASRAIAELTPLGNGFGLRAAMQVAETDGLAANMLTALLGHELVAGHAAMMKLSAKIDRWLALIADDRLPEDQERGTREAVRLAVAASRLSERYRVGLLSLAKLRGWDGGRVTGASAAGHAVEPDDLAAAAEIAAALLGDGPDDGPDGGGPNGGVRAAAKALHQLHAVRGRYGAALGNGHANGAAKPNGAAASSNSLSHFGSGQGGGSGAGSKATADRRRGTLRHGNPSGDFLAAPRCGARTRAGCACRQPAMPNGRCRLHGGRSTGARTASGLARIRANRLVHGARTAEIIDLRSAAARHGRNLRTLARLAKAPHPQFDRSTPCPATTASSAAPSTGATNEHGYAQLNMDGMDARLRRAAARSAFIPPYRRSSAVKPSPAAAPDRKSERSTPCPARPRRAAAG